MLEGQTVGIWSKLNVSSKTFIKTYASKWTIVW